MPWQEVRPMDLKIRFISDYLNEYFTFTELCTRFGISRKTGYKWVSRYLVSGSLNDLSRKPHTSPTQTPLEVVESILKVRVRHPSRGPRKLLWRIEKDHPDWKLPAYSTAALILNRHGYIKAKRKKIKRSHPGQPVTPITYPNEVYVKSDRPMPAKLLAVEYPGHYEIRKVSKNCGIRWNHRRVCVSQVLAGEYVGLEEISTGEMHKIITSQAITLAIAVVGAVLGITNTWRHVTRDRLRVIVDESVLYIYYIKLEVR
jgi:transposase-like protein